ncbi:MAG: methyltransferase domain-containing protein, partial [Solirubrobacteraceae bacterium]
MEATLSADEIRDVNTRYHDVAAHGYDSKWGIDFGAVGQAQVLGKLRKLLGAELDRGYDRSLEVGAGTGYFSLNLLQTGVVTRATATDISPGMVATLRHNAARLGLEIDAARADAESLPFADASFDLVLGHAVLHHLPDLDRAFAEFHRLLRPGGRILFAGEPSRVGDRLAEVTAREETRMPTGISEFDRVLGGGLVPGAVVLIGGDPGIGKSTLLLQALAALDGQARTLYVSGEESAEQVALRARRLELAAGT